MQLVEVKINFSFKIEPPHYLVDPASSDTLPSKIKPCMSQYSLDKRERKLKRTLKRESKERETTSREAEIITKWRCIYVSRLQTTRMLVRVLYTEEFRYIQEVPAYLNSTNIDNLQPNTKYVLTISAISVNDTEGIKSHEIDFVSPSSGE
ncbi:hypothetical protein RND71_043646 [Anisodus tanguticus]|uniref:Uncharacterized protein n=1 Tax=Anisodus tanguticus TaxID=243964 RepID=A0AAE1QSR3_9SOLA|nr:hypothetical protein RND71_043646 [Anisodus tanguticus]